MTSPTPRRLIKAGIERLPAQPDLPRHQHHEAYVTVVFKGAYEQASYVGRFTAGAGDVILQPTFDCHSDRMLSQGVELLRLPWRRELSLGGVFDGLPTDEIRRAAERDVLEATAMVEDLLQVRSPRPTEAGHSADLLAMALVKSPDVRIEAWAERQGLARATVSRQFRARYGVHPAQFRSEVRARTAWARLVSSRSACAAIAYDLGFSDQAHMTRAVKWLTGKPPSAWRSGMG